MTIVMVIKLDELFSLNSNEMSKEILSSKRPGWYFLSYIKSDSFKITQLRSEIRIWYHSGNKLKIDWVSVVWLNFHLFTNQIWFLILKIPFFPSKPTRRQRLKAVGGASERSERGRSALFKNPLFFSGKFLGCYIEAAQNSIRYVPFLWQIGHKKITLLNWF